MAKKPAVRIASVDEDVMALVDRGREIDEEIKNLVVEDKGTKKLIGDAAQQALEPGEFTVKLDGKESRAMVAVVEKYELDASKPEFETALAHVKAGVFGDAVTETRSLAIPPGDIEKAARLLSSAGIQAMVKVEHEVDAEEYRALVASTPSSTETKNAIEALKGCVVRKATTRVTYEKK